jgi:hypothetical protein
MGVIMDERRDDLVEPMWNEDKKEVKGFLEEKFQGFDPTTMPEPETEGDLLRKRLRLKNKNRFEGGDE